MAIAQINTTAGDVPGNTQRVREAWRAAAEAGADLLVTPELAVVGYPPRDLLLRASVCRAAETAVRDLAEEFADGPDAILGSVWTNPRAFGPPIVNAAVHCAGGRVRKTYAKRLLPTYDVFDERRYFAPGDEPCVIQVAGKRVGVLVCEDLWVRDPVYGRLRYVDDPVADLVEAGIDVAVAISASPYHGGKDSHRRTLFSDEARRMGVPLVTAHQVGGNDDVLFDGRSRVFDPAGGVRLSMPGFDEDFRVVDLDDLPPPLTFKPDDPPEELRRALVMGIRDYCAKTGLGRVLLGLSGGVDSAVVACLAADALGPDKVLTVGMPGPFTAQMSRDDARDLAERIGVQFIEIPITGAYTTMLQTLHPQFGERAMDVTEENLQARLRGVTLMALSNKFGHLVLTTGNKSEVAVGYCTLYGDMNGGLAVISDVWKTQVYDIARRYVEAGRMPERIVTRPPSAELAPDQKDSDSLPPYEVLDQVLQPRIEDGASFDEIVARGESPEMVERVLKMVERNEYKRRQMAPGLKVSPVAFGVGWRMPIARPIDLRNEVHREPTPQ